MGLCKELMAFSSSTPNPSDIQTSPYAIRARSVVKTIILVDFLIRIKPSGACKANSQVSKENLNVLNLRSGLGLMPSH